MQNMNRAHVQGLYISLVCVLLLPLLKHLFPKLQKLFLNLLLGLGKVHSLFMLDPFFATLFDVLLYLESSCL